LGEIPTGIGVLSDECAYYTPTLATQQQLHEGQIFGAVAMKNPLIGTCTGMHIGQNPMNAMRLAKLN